MHCRTAASMIILVLMLSGQALASNGSIGVYFDTDCARCSGTASFEVPMFLYINVTLAGATANGFAGAEFRVTGLPSGWLASPSPNPLANVALGDPFGAGCNIAFPSCMSSPSGCVNLYSAWVLPESEATNVYLQVQAHLNSQNPALGGPILVLCDPPTYTQVLAEGGTGILNGPPCTVATAPTTWSNVKALYRGAGR